jgi:hypothetical protein
LHPFGCGTHDRSPPAFPHRWHDEFRLPQASRLLQSSNIRSLPSLRATGPKATCPRRERLPWGSTCPLHDVTTGCPLTRERPRSRWRSVLGVPPALDGLLHLVAGGLVSSHSRVQGSPFRGLPSPRSRVWFPRPLPSGRYLCASYRRTGVRSAPRPDFKALLPAMSPLARAGGLDRLEPRSPLGISPPPGVCLLTVETPSRLFRP